MASYLRSIFGYGSSSSSAPTSKAPTSKAPTSSKTHSRARSQPTNYIYGPPGTVSSTASASASSRPALKKVHSNSASRSNTPSPLRYATFDSRGSHSHRDEHPRPKASSSHGHTSAPAPSPIYRRASYKHKEHHVHYPSFAPGYVTPGSSRSNSTSSLYPGATPMGTPMPLASSSHVNVNSKDRRPVLKQNHTWSGVSTSASGSSSYGHSPRSPLHPSMLHMHPLLSYTRLHHAPISYDITFTPSARTVLDRHTHSPVPAHTLAQPATEPPTPASARLVLSSHKFPWLVVVGPVGSTPSFYAGSTPGKHSRSNSASSACLTNLDVLYAVHTTLMTRVTPEEWESLGHASRAQRKVAAAYEKRCQKMGGGWEGGVRRIDWLGSKTRLVGVEVDKSNRGGAAGKLVFGKA